MKFLTGHGAFLYFALIRHARIRQNMELRAGFAKQHSQCQQGQFGKGRVGLTVFTQPCIIRVRLRTERSEERKPKVSRTTH